MKKIATLAATAAMLIAPSAALAKTFRQTGFINGDKAASVKLRVAVDNHHPQKVAGFEARNVHGRCGKKAIRITLTAVTPIKVDGHRFKASLHDDNGGVLRIAGRVKDGGRRTTGHLKTNRFQSGSKTCKVPRQGFRTSA